MSYTPVMLQRVNDETESYEDVKRLYALKVNRKSGAESFDSAAGQYHLTLTFRFAYTKVFEQVRFEPQHFRLVYNDQPFSISDYDDYMEQHLFVNITGVAYG